MARDAPEHGAYGFRDWRTEDGPELTGILREDGLWRHLFEDRTEPFDLDGVLAWIAKSKEAADHWVQAVTLHGEVIGQVRAQHEAGARAELSYWFRKALWGRGHGGAAVAQFTDMVFERFAGLQVLFARIDRDNHASRRLVRRLGSRVAPSLGDDRWQVFERRRVESAP